MENVRHEVRVSKEKVYCYKCGKKRDWDGNITCLDCRVKIQMIEKRRRNGN